VIFKRALVAGFFVLPLVAIPCAAYAASGSHEWDWSVNLTDYGSWKRVPGDESNDYSGGSTSGQGDFITDTDKCVSGQTNQYSTRLRRDRSFQPDETIEEFDYVGFCKPQQQSLGLSWSSGKFHTDVRLDTNNVGTSGWSYMYWYN
jgi:hypothetical protein